MDRQLTDECDKDSNMSAELRDLHVDSVEPNLENPRQIFHATQDDRLAESIDTSGVLVPVYVYEDGDRFRLIDGERRWRQACRLGLETIPALVRSDAPGNADNILEMFNIHLVRAQWDDMPTARALAKVIERTGVQDLNELKRITGLSKEKIKDYQLILELPSRYQEMIGDGLPMNFFVELEENVIRPLARKRPQISKKFVPDTMRDNFLAKRDAGSLRDIVELRKMREIIIQAAEDAGAPEEKSPLDPIIENLITNPSSKIEDAYTEVALARVELANFSKNAHSLISAVDRLLRVSEDDEQQRAEVSQAIQETVTALQARLDGLK